jgi:hypothetical protein
MTRAQMKRAAMALSQTGTYSESARNWGILVTEIDWHSPRTDWACAEDLYDLDMLEASILMTEACAPSHEPSTRTQEEWSRDSMPMARG